MAITLPHFDAPFALGPDGKPRVNQQDSAADVAASVRNIVSCPQGAKVDDPEFGVPDVLWGVAPGSWAPLAQAITAQEPRASVTAVQAAIDPNGRTVDVNVLVQALTQGETT